jgi:hypothetical protein
MACTNCGIQTGAMKKGLTIFHDCKLTGWRRTKAFLKDLTKWMRAGFPMRTQKQAQAIYEEHCLPCDARVVENGIERCKDCGCPLKQKASLVSKLQWETSHCPRKKW